MFFWFYVTDIHDRQLTCVTITGGRQVETGTWIMQEEIKCKAWSNPNFTSAGIHIIQIDHLYGKPENVKSAVNGFNLDSDLVKKFLKDYTVLAKNGKKIILCWIPSHVGILGNEKADAAAKSALSLPVTRMKLPATGMYPRITKLIFDEWQEVWSCYAGNKLHAIKPTVGGYRKHVYCAVILHS